MPIKISLTPKQIKELLLTKRKNKSDIILDRTQAILAINNGVDIKNIAKVLSRSDKFVKNAFYLYKKGKLKDIQYKGNNKNLSSEQKDEIIKIIQEQTPKELADFKFKEQFWETDILKILIKKKYNIEYKTDKSYYDLFKAAGFSFKSPKPRDFRQDPEKMKEFKGALKKSSTTTKIRMSW